MTSSTLVSRAQGSGSKRGSVTIERDEYGVPHVYGSTLEAAWYGVGCAQGQDRLWQAELLRRSATGTSAEIMGRSAVPADVLARTVFGPLERRKTLFANASPDTKIFPGESLRRDDSGKMRIWAPSGWVSSWPWS